MGLTVRKIVVLVISLQAVLIAFLIYTKMNSQPELNISSITESNSQNNNSAGDIGTIGDLGVGSVHKAKYVTLSKDSKPVREFGFDKLLHAQGDEWQLEKPYLNIFNNNFACYITADQGHVQIEDAMGKPNPMDATLAGNVIIHVIPKQSSEIGETYIYLDDIVFISEESRFTTDGPVKFISSDLHAVGKGLEVVYDHENDRLELFRIVKLDSIRLRTASAAMVSDMTGKGNNSQSTAASTNASADDRNGLAVKYKCLLSSNVVIDAPDQLIFADRISVSNIDLKSNAGPTKKHNSSGNSRPDQKPDQSQKGYNYVFITSDGPLTLVPADSPGIGGSIKGSDVPPDDYEAKLPDFTDRAGGRVTFAAESIDYDIDVADIVASGFSQLTFYATDKSESGSKKALPVKVNASKSAVFSRSAGTVVFTGNPTCSVISADSGQFRQYSLAADTLTVKIENASQDLAGSAPAESISSLIANGNAAMSVQQPGTHEDIARFEAQTIEYDGRTREIFASGTSKLTLMTERPGNGGPMPITITAQKQTKFLPTINTALFEGQCLTTIMSFDADQQKKYTLASQNLSVRFADSAAGGSTAGNLELVTAQGDVTVAVRGVDKDKDSMHFASQKIDYYGDRGLIVADGPSKTTFLGQAMSSMSVADQPVTITAQDRAEFSTVSNTVSFLGNCLCKMTGSVANQKSTYTLAAQRLDVDLVEKKISDPASSSAIKYFTAQGKVKISVSDEELTSEVANFSAETIFYDLAGELITARGDSELVMYSAAGQSSLGLSVPVKITAHEKTTFSTSTNRAVFQGNCLSTMTAAIPGGQRKYSLSAPQLVVDLADNDSDKSPYHGRIRRLVAQDGLVQLSNAKYIEGDLAGFTRLKCFRFEYDSNLQAFTAKGPGVLVVDNSRAQDDLGAAGKNQLLNVAAPDTVLSASALPQERPKKQNKKFSLEKSCYAFVQNFDTLNYSVRNDRVVALAGDEPLNVTYIPIIDGKYDEQVKVTTNRMRADLVREPAGQFDLATLAASGGITYTDTDNQFIAGNLFYDAGTSLVIARGDSTRNCLLNGTVVDAIEYSLKTGSVNARINSPATVDLRR